VLEKKPVTFKSGAQEFGIALNVTALKRVKAMTGVDLMDALDGSLLQKLRKDPCLLVDIIWAIVKPEAGTMTDEEFGSGMAGDAIEHATKALLDAIVAFCPSPRDRQILGRLLEKAEATEEKVRTAIDARVEGIDPAKLAEEVMAGASGSSSGSAPGSSA